MERIPGKIQSFSNQKNFRGIEKVAEFDVIELRKDTESFKILSLIAFFKVGLEERYIRLLSKAALIEKNWYERIYSII